MIGLIPDWLDEVNDDDDSATEDSDDDSLNNRLCTFTQTQKEFMNQHWLVQLHDKMLILSLSNLQFRC